MTIRTRMLVILLLFGVAAVVIAEVNHTRYRTYSFTTSSALDTAKIVKVGDDWVVLDSFAYADSFSVSGDTTTHVTITWTSPAQKMTVTPTFDASTTYTCSINTGAGATGFDLDATGLTTLAQLTAAFADSVNDVAGMKDTIIAADSVTFVQITSLLAQTALTSKIRWTLSLPVSGGSGANDTASLTTNSIAIIQDSMVANINASDTAGFYVTAANSGDTAHTLTANQKGLFFFIATLPQDTAGDTITTIVNLDSTSTQLDTFDVVNMMAGKGTTLIGRIIVSEPVSTVGGVGLSDSIIIRKYTRFGSTLIQLKDDSANCTSFPCTLMVTYTGDVSGVDTLFKETFSFVIEVVDSTTDSAFTVQIPYRYQIIQRKANE